MRKEDERERDCVILGFLAGLGQGRGLPSLAGDWGQTVRVTKPCAVFAFRREVVSDCAIADWLLRRPEEKPKPQREGGRARAGWLRSQEFGGPGGGSGMALNEFPRQGRQPGLGRPPCPELPCPELPPFCRTLWCPRGGRTGFGL